MGNKKINKEDWTKPLTSEEKRKYMVSIFIVALTIGLFIGMRMLLADWDISHREKVHISVRISVLPILASVFLQYAGVPIFYKIDKKHRVRRLEIVRMIMLVALYSNLITIFIKLLKFEVLPIYIYSVIAIQMIMVAIATYNFFKLDEESKVSYKNKFILISLSLIGIWIVKIWFVINGRFIV